VWSYFEHEPDVKSPPFADRDDRLGYGHYFVFAAVAPLGAGLQVAADTTHDATGLTPAVAALTVAIPVAVYLVAMSFLHGRRTLPILVPIAIIVALVIGPERPRPRPRPC
jgi:low temperature requirement A protein (LtrA)